MIILGSESDKGTLRATALGVLFFMAGYGQSSYSSRESGAELRSRLPGVWPVLGGGLTAGARWV